MGREKTQFKKGVSGNPSGKPPKDPLITKFQETKYRDFINSLQEFGAIPHEELRKKVLDKKTKVFDVIFGRILCDAMAGKTEAQKILLERLWGKVKDQVEFTNQSGGPQIIVSLPANGYEASLQPSEKNPE